MKRKDLLLCVVVVLLLAAKPAQAGGVWTSPNWHPKATFAKWVKSFREFFETPYWSGQ